jgi:hypothetical protein
MRRGAWISWFGIKTKVDGFFRFGLKTGGFWFPGLGVKIGSYGLVICTSKSQRQFLGLGLKTNQAMICQLRHKTDGRMKMVGGTRPDLMAYFTWKQVRLGLPSLASRLVEARRIWCTWHQRGCCIELKLKMNGSM